MIIVIVTFLAFILEYIFNGFFHGTIFSGLIIFSSLILLEPFFKKNKDKFFIFCFIVGFLYDIVYTGTYFMNAGIFLLVGVLVCFINSATPNNFIVSILELILMILVYRIITFLFFVFNDIIDFDFFLLFKSFYCSILLNLIYGIVLYFVLFLISRLFNVKRIN